MLKKLIENELKMKTKVQSWLLALFWGFLICIQVNTKLYAQNEYIYRNHVTKAFLSELTELTSLAQPTGNVLQDIENIQYISDRPSLLSLYVLLFVLRYHQEHAIVNKQQEVVKIVTKLLPVIVDMATNLEVKWVRKSLYQIVQQLSDILNTKNKQYLMSYINGLDQLNKQNKLPFFYSQDVTLSNGHAFPFEKDFISENSFHYLMQCLFNTMNPHTNHINYMQRLKASRSSLLILFLHLYTEIAMSLLESPPPPPPPPIFI